MIPRPKGMLIMAFDAFSAALRPRSEPPTATPKPVVEQPDALLTELLAQGPRTEPVYPVLRSTPTAQPRPRPARDTEPDQDAEAKQKSTRIGGWDYAAALGSEIVLHGFFWLLAALNFLFTVEGVMAIGWSVVAGVVLHIAISLIEQHGWKRGISLVVVIAVAIAVAVDVGTSVVGLAAMIERFAPQLRVLLGGTSANVRDWWGSGAYAYPVAVIVFAAFAALSAEWGIRHTWRRIRRVVGMRQK